MGKPGLGHQPSKFANLLLAQEQESQTGRAENPGSNPGDRTPTISSNPLHAFLQSNSMQKLITAHSCLRQIPERPGTINPRQVRYLFSLRKLARLLEAKMLLGEGEDE
jgi:hypothetical protein